MPSASPLQRILHPISVDEFADKYFQRRPLRIRGAPGKFDFLFRESDFHVNLDRVDFIRAVFPGNWNARIQPADIEHMLRAGATICVNGMENAHAKLLQAARRVRAELNYPGSVAFRAYLSPPGAGFDLHFDARITTTLQIAGHKRWWFSTQPALPFPLYNSGREPRGSAPAYKVPTASTLRSVLLQPGDVLCLPAGVWHRAKGTTASLALNMAIDHFGAGTFDSIVNVLERRLKRHPSWRQPLPAAPRRNGQGVPEPVASMLRERIDMLCRELSAMRDDETLLRETWELAVRSPPRR